MLQLVRQIIDELGEFLYRYKGVLNIAGIDKKFVFQGVGMLFNGNFTTEWDEVSGQWRSERGEGRGEIGVKRKIVFLAKQLTN